MKGKILDFSLQTSSGVISGEDGNRYNFVSAEWKSSDTHPAQGLEVDFDVDDENNAKAIYIESPVVATSSSSSSSMDAASMWANYVDVLKNKYASFDGRADKSQFWYYQLVNIGISIVLSIISAGGLGVLYSLAVMVPGFAIGARRLHDTGKSGWWQLLLAIPLIGVIVLIIFWIKDSDKGANQYGEA